MSFPLIPKIQNTLKYRPHKPGGYTWACVDTLMLWPFSSGRLPCIGTCGILRHASLQVLYRCLSKIGQGKLVQSPVLFLRRFLPSGLLSSNRQRCTFVRYTPLSERTFWTQGSCQDDAPEGAQTKSKLPRKPGVRQVPWQTSTSCALRKVTNDLSHVHEFRFGILETTKQATWQF